MKMLGITALAGALMLCAAQVWAAIMIYPKFVDFGQTARVQEMTLVNPSPEETVTYRVRFKYAHQNPDGTYTEVEQPGFTTAKDLVRFSPRSITLAPGKSQRVKLLRRVSADTPPGEYTGYIVFTQIPDEKPLQKASSSAAPGMRIELTAIPSFSIPVILTHGETKPDVPGAFKRRSRASRWRRKSHFCAILPAITYWKTIKFGRNTGSRSIFSRREIKNA